LLGKINNSDFGVTFKTVILHAIIADDDIAGGMRIQKCLSDCNSIVSNPDGTDFSTTLR